VRELDGAGIGIAPPQGAFYLFPDFKPHAGRLNKRGVKTGRDLANQLLADAGVAVLPGSDFGREKSELTARLSLVDFDGAEALTRSEMVPLDEPLPQEFLESATADVLEGIDRIVRWLDA
jgi:aspartate aminotransferase